MIGIRGAMRDLILLLALCIVTWPVHAQTPQQRMDAARAEEERLLRLRDDLISMEQAVGTPVWVVTETGPVRIVDRIEFERLARSLGEWSFGPLYNRNAVGRLPSLDQDIIAAFGIRGLRTAAKRPDGMDLLLQSAALSRRQYLIEIDINLERARDAFTAAMAERDGATDAPEQRGPHVIALGPLPPLPDGMGKLGEAWRDTSCVARDAEKLFDPVRFVSDITEDRNCNAPFITTGWDRSFSPKRRTCAWCGAGYQSSKLWYGCCLTANR